MSKTAEAQADSVGALLRQARELKGLTTADVATHLRLKVSQIEQIEAEEWDPAVSATFMRGYLRAYARFLKMPEKEILQNFELQAAFLRHQAKPMHSFSKKNRLDAVDNRFMLATYLLVVLLIGLFLIWFWQTHLLDSQPVSVVPEYRINADETVNQPIETTLPSTTAQPEVAVTVAPANAAVGQLNALPAEVMATNDAAPVENAQPLPSTAPSTQQTETSVVAPAAAPVQSEDQAVPTETLEPTQAENLPSAESVAVTAEPTDSQEAANALSSTAVSSTPVSSTAVSTPVNSSGQTAQLQLTFHGDCWVTVQDATGKRLAYGLKTVGQSLQLTGVLPLSVTLGNATAATVQLNQTAVDLSAYRAGQVARLTLDGQP